MYLRYIWGSTQPDPAVLVTLVSSISHLLFSNYSGSNSSDVMVWLRPVKEGSEWVLQSLVFIQIYKSLIFIQVGMQEQIKPFCETKKVTIFQITCQTTAHRSNVFLLLPEPRPVQDTGLKNGSLLSFKQYFSGMRRREESGPWSVQNALPCFKLLNGWFLYLAFISLGYAFIFFAAWDKLFSERCLCESRTAGPNSASLLQVYFKITSTLWFK